jgi:acetylornithine/succinyldiaminopimelate/putrescine aminotransferase
MLRHPVVETCDTIVRQRIPNLLRLYLNPYVTQACFCLMRYVQTTWSHSSRTDDDQTFLANGFDEALSGAIKLARYCASLDGRPTTGLIVDAANRLGAFASAAVAGGERIGFVPGLTVVGPGDPLPEVGSSQKAFGFVVLIAAEDGSLRGHDDAVRHLVQAHGLLVVTCVDRDSLAALRRGSAAAANAAAGLSPDIVVFDESFVNHDVPFAAFTARKRHYRHWNRRGKTTFHSTTYQPNTIASLHFLRCLKDTDPVFHATVEDELEKIATDLKTRGSLFRRLYSPSLYRAIRATGFNTANVRASGDFLDVAGRKVFDGVSGVACSVRGHNPETYISDIESLGSTADVEAEVAARLHDLTGLDHVVPSVSGASGVETALKLALVAQYPKRYVLALKSGFGGKTLLALTSTANPTYKERIDPLYPYVVYVDPFAADAEVQIESALEKYPVAVVQVELIQAVGGVRRVPENVLRFLEAGRSRWDYLLLVDEVQTGMYRTGPFSLAHTLKLSPDLLVLGKGTSDMMLPFGLVLFTAGVRDKLDRAGCDLPSAIRQRYGYEIGFKTVLNVLRQGEKLRLSERVTESGALFGQLLREGLGSCPAVRDIRVFGLLIGIELDSAGWTRRWFRRRLYSFYLANMLRHRHYPVLVGFCQYEPNVLKLTPSLTVAQADIHAACSTIIEVVRRPFPRLLAAAMASLIGAGRPTIRGDHNEQWTVDGGPLDQKAMVTTDS